jgi:hypothetical protein
MTEPDTALSTINAARDAISAKPRHDRTACHILGMKTLVDAAMEQDPVTPPSAPAARIRLLIAVDVQNEI